VIEIIDNFLELSDLVNIQNYIFDKNLPWQYGQILEEYMLECDPLENHQLSHMIFAKGEYGSSLKLLIPILKKLEANVLLKAKANLTWRRNSNIKIGWHTDIIEGNKNILSNPKTAIYYLNTNNGSTIINKENSTVVNCIENRIVIFDSNQEHIGVTCSDKKNKVLLNINYY